MSSNSPIIPPELLAPAGHWDCARAAVANGADAIYFGLDAGFNARARAVNFQVDELPDLMAFLHRYGVKGYVTLNTIAFSDELPQLEQLIRTLADAAVDAVLIQDLGLARLVRATAPQLAIHASTQMTMTSAETITQIAPLGIERVVLARELSVQEIAAIHQATEMPLEVFVHGALCVAYSGQCLTSESLGGRSANRGQCAQACRLPYELICDGQDVDLKDQRYLLSPQDLAAYALIPELIAAGVCSLKIEGRLKTPEYVANITRHYRQAIDAAVAGQPIEFTPRDIEEMELSFSRGFSPGWLKGCDHKMLVPATSSAKRGVRVGTVIRCGEQGVHVQLDGTLQVGDGVVFEGDRLQGDEQGGRVFQLLQEGIPVDKAVTKGRVELTFAKEDFQFDRLTAGQTVWKTDDPRLTRKWKKTYQGEITGRDRPVSLEVAARVGSAISLAIQCEGLPLIQVTGDAPLETARKHPLTKELLREQFGRLGGTGFVLNGLSAEISGAPMVPLSVLGALRKEMVRQLAAARESADRPKQRLVDLPPVLPQLRPAVRQEASTPDAVHSDAKLSVLCRSLSQLDAVCEAGTRRIYADFQDIRQYREAVARAHYHHAEIVLATPRIQKPGELGIFHLLARYRPDGVLVRNLSGLEFFHSRGFRCVSDYSFNAANELTIAWLRERGALLMTPSYDMNRDQLLLMVSRVGGADLEVVVHQHMPMFHMEHCVFCAVLSPGTNKTNCGRPCDDHLVELRDRVGAQHPLRADVGCRNTLYNSVPQSGAEVVSALQQLGVTKFRIELLHDAPSSEIASLISLYQRLMEGAVDATVVWQSLHAINRVGVTRGTLEHSRDPLAVL
ncbi:MAG: DUF3656 domain-containing protein [Planctomycetaceae bacterium]